MIWLVAFAACPAPCAPKCADHDRERAVACTFDATADRRIEKLDLARGQPLRRLTRRVAADRRAVDDETTAGECRRETIDDGEHIGIG